MAHACLLATCWDAARELANRSPVLRWSLDIAQGLTVACFLAGLSGRPMDALPVHLAALWRSQLEAGLELSAPSWGEKWHPAVTLDRLMDAYREPFAALWSSRARLSSHIEWSLDMAKRRIHTIVSEQQRRRYGNAARWLMACCEHLQARGEGERAATLLAEVRERFPRHRAFQAEVEAALARTGGRADAAGAQNGGSPPRSSISDRR